MGTRVVPDSPSAKVDSFLKIFEIVMFFSIFHPEDGLKRVSSLAQSILREILRFPMPGHVSRLLLAFEIEQIWSKISKFGRSGSLPTKGIT